VKLALPAALVTAAAIAVVTAPDSARSDLHAVYREKAAVGCVGTCVPESDYLAMKRLAAKRLRGWRKSNRLVVRLRARWRPSVLYAIKLASRVYGVSEAQMRAVSLCESHWDPFAQNGRYKGIFQLGWSPFGLSPYEPLANALSAAQTVAHDGSWRQWECKPS
jgi:hypothetical protein